MASRRSGRGQTLQPSGRRSGVGMVAPPDQVPEGAPPAGESEAATNAPLVPPGALRAYAEGRMDPADVAEMEGAIQRGEYRVPPGFQLRPQSRSVLDRSVSEIPGAALEVAAGAGRAIKEAVTGEQRQTETTRAADDIVMSPEWAKVQDYLGTKRVQAPAESLADIPATAARGAYNALAAPFVEPFRASLREASSPEEQMKMIQEANPGLKIQRDEKGNAFFISPTDQKKYTIQPGLNVTDAPRVLTNAALYAAGGPARGILKAGAAAAGTQGLIEAEQAASGGTFDPIEVALAGVGGAAGEGLGRVVQGVRGARAAAAAPAAAEGAEQAAKAAVPETLPGPELGRMVKAADAGDAAAKRQIAAMADVDVDAAKAAVELGLDVPIGVLAKNQQIGEINAALRAKMGSEAAGSMAALERDLAKKADEALEGLGAAFVEGRVAPAGVGDRVLASLQGTIGQLKSEADSLYKAVDTAVPPASRVPMDNVKDLLEKRIAEYGGDVAGLSQGEQRLLRLVERQGADAAEGAATYRALVDEKAAIQRALRNEMAQGPYASADKRILGMLESALKNDQLAAVEALGGAASADALKSANRLTFRRKALEARAMQAFGKDLEGDLAPLMKRALSGAARGENKALKQLLKVVPPEMRQEAAATALASIGRKLDGAFSPTLFAKQYPALRANPEAFGALVKELGPGSEKLLSALYALSNRVSIAAQRTPRTGKALDELGALDGFVGKIAESSLAKKAAMSAGAVAGSAMGGGFGAAAGAGVADHVIGMLTSNKGRVIDAAANLMRDPVMVELALEQASGAVTDATVKKAARSPALREFLRAAKMPRTPTDAEAWIWGAVRGVRAGEQE